MRLAALIEALEAIPQDLVLPKGFTRPHSWRSDYYELAFEPLDKPVSVGQLLVTAKSALDTKFEGYKGGWYTMSGESVCHLAEYGSCGDGETISQGVLDGWLLAATLEIERLDIFAAGYAYGHKSCAGGWSLTDETIESAYAAWLGQQ